MSKSFGRELEVLRKKSGLSQRDIAHLLGTDQGRVSMFEAGDVSPSIRQLAKFSLIFGLPMETLIACDARGTHKGLGKQLETLPRLGVRFRKLANRQSTLNHLAARLEAHSDAERERAA